MWENTSPTSWILLILKMGKSRHNLILTIYGHKYLPTFDDHAILYLRNYRCQRLALNFLEHQCLIFNLWVYFMDHCYQKLLNIKHMPLYGGAKWPKIMNQIKIHLLNQIS